MSNFTPHNYSLDTSLNKFISSTGYCSRREADALIAAGRVHLNDKVASMANRYRPGNEVYVDGVRMKAPSKEKFIVMAFNKPEGITTTTDTNTRDNIIDYINYPKRIFPIGRLDKDSEGLIFLTNDGDIVNKILRAGNQHEKEYLVQVDKSIDVAFLRKMAAGVVIDGKQTLPCKLKQTGRQSFSIILVQGLNRQIRKMCEALGYKVTKLQRVRIMHINLAGLRVGKWRLLSDPEMTALNNAIEGSSAVAEKKSKSAPIDVVKIKTAPTKEGKRTKYSVIENTQKGRKPIKSSIGDHTKNDNKRTKYVKAEKSKESGGLKKSNSEKRSAPKKGPDTKNKSAKQGSFKSYRIRGRKS